MPPKVTKSKGTKPVYGTGGVSYSFVGDEGGPIEIRIDFSMVAVPPGYCYADALTLSLDDQLRMATLSFWRRALKGKRSSDRVDIVMPKKSLLGQFWTSSREVEKTLDQALGSGWSAPTTDPATIPDETAAILFANAIFSAVGEGESTLDFYHLAPREVHLAKTHKKPMEIQPVIRVIMSSVLTKHFFEELRPFAEEETALRPTVERSRRAIR